MTSNEFQSSWHSFLDHIASLYGTGKREREISEIIGVVTVRWEGVVTEINLSEEFSPGIAITMEPGCVTLNNGESLRSDYQYLKIDPKNNSAWQQCERGGHVRFKARITRPSGPFTSIRLSKAKEGKEVLLMIALYDFEFISVA